MRPDWERLSSAHRLLARASLACVVGCSSSSVAPPPLAGAACGSTPACGGDIAGTWIVDSECLTIASPFADPACQSAEGRSDVTVTGSVAYTPASGDAGTGTQQVALRYAFVIDEVYSAACLTAIGLGGATPDACRSLEAYWAGPYAVTCTPAHGECACAFSDEDAVTTTDTYTVDGSQLVTGASGAVDFCRTGDVLVESSSTSNLTMHRRAP